VDKRPAAVRRMFGAIAPVYDLMNTLMSAGAHRAWRRRAARRCAGARRVLDVATGTGDMAAAVGGRVVGIDSARPMLARARRKYGLALAEADALRLPFPDGAFDACTVAFGVRNFADLEAGLRELARVLAPGGRLVILELVMPPGLVTAAYLSRWIPWLARRVAGSRADAYRYLADSIAGFAGADELGRRVEGAGLREARVERFGFGFACLVTATRPAAGGPAGASAAPAPTTPAPPRA
jgi:demethylmenaquinone methyltransferase/2-methoxy-6-polyprenyl-1,4-benzoquinol methylase